jgi:hypothetical protein
MYEEKSYLGAFTDMVSTVAPTISTLRFFDDLIAASELPFFSFVDTSGRWRTLDGSWWLGLSGW